LSGSKHENACGLTDPPQHPTGFLVSPSGPPQGLSAPSGNDRGLRLTLYVRIHNLFATYFNLNCFYVSAENPSNWLPLFYSRNSLHNPTHYESLFGKNRDRFLYNGRNYERLRKERKTFYAKHRGFYDLFTPMVDGGSFRGFLATGSFVRSPFTEAEISREWTSLSGRRSDAPDPDFAGYARMALDTVVLSPMVLEGFKEVLEILADLLGGRADEGMAERLEELRKGPISHGLPHAVWMDFMLGLNQFHPRVTVGGTPNWWEREELGISRYPTTVLAVTQPAPVLERLSTLKSMAGAVRLQWEALKAAREFPETVAGKLEDYGALFVTSASPAKSRVQAKLEIRDRMEAIRRRLEKRAGFKLVAGVGSTLAPGVKLIESRLQAVLAMNLAASTGRSMVFYEEEAWRIQAGKGRGLRPALGWLRKAYRNGSPRDREAARAEFVRQALLYSHERPESLRAHLLEACAILTETLLETALKQAEAEGMARSLEEGLLQASTLQGMLSVFRDGLDRIGAVGDRPAEGRRAVRMEEVKRYVDRHFTQSPQLKDLARKMGLSEPAFLRGFRRTTGRGFSRYLQSLRLDEAKRLLRTSLLSVERVAQESGFNSASYFVQAFKRVTGFTPGAYRGQGRPFGKNINK
jgi:AraC-like DNA-binding protein